MNRFSCRFSQNVPERHVDAAHGVEHGPVPPVIESFPVHRLPNLLEVEWVLTEQELPQPVASAVRHLCINHCFPYLWRGIDLTVADDAFVGFNANQQIVLCAVGNRAPHRKTQNNGLDIGDFHWPHFLPSYLLGQATCRTGRSMFARNRLTCQKRLIRCGPDSQKDRVFVVEPQSSL